MTIPKIKIQTAFDRGADHYDDYALLQKETAETLMRFAPDSAPEHILDIGCGTGFLTGLLIQKYPKATITALDISKKMMAQCQQKYPSIRPLCCDAENFIPPQRYDMIISNLTAQWFQTPDQTWMLMKNALTDRGALLYSTLGGNSFKEWRQTLKTLNYPSGLLPLEQTLPDFMTVLHHEEKIISYPDGWTFLKSIKKIGATASYQRPLNPVQLTRAINHFEKTAKNKMTWDILIGQTGAKTA